VTELSIVTSTYNSEASIKEFLKRVREAVSALELWLSRSVTFEIVVTDDGSTDNTCRILENEINDSKELKVLVLARNYGQHQAMLRGMLEAVGEVILILDSDLEDDPAWLLCFWKKLRSEKFRSVHGEYIRTDGPYWRRKGGEFFWRLYNRLSSLDLPISQTMARLMERDFLDAALASRRMSGLLAQIFVSAGKSQPVIVERFFKGKSSYSIRQKFSMAARQILISSDEIWWRLTVVCLGAGAVGCLVAVCAALLGMNFSVIAVGISMGVLFLPISAVTAGGYMLRGMLAIATDSQPVIIQRRITIE
jgi:putative glycosyltransferase